MGKNRRQYALFWKRDGRWVRLTSLSCHLDGARRLFQTYLFAGSMCGAHMALRAVDGDLDEAGAREASVALDGFVRYCRGEGR